MDLYLKIENFLGKLIKYIMFVLLIVMTVITTTEVVRRYIFGLSFPWAEELVRFSLIWLTFIGGSWVFKKGDMVLFDMAISHMSKKNRSILALIMNTLVLMFLGYLFYYSCKFSFSPVIVKQISAGLRISMAVPYCSIPIGFGLMIFFGLGKYSALLKNFKEEGGK